MPIQDVISRDVVFIEEEARDGIIDKLVGKEVVTLHAKDEEDEKGMIFLRIRRGNYLTFRATGKKPHVNRRTHQSVNYQIKSFDVSWGNYCMDSGVW